jgi:hypothetical protein
MIFLSHSSHDRSAALKIKRLLQRHSLQVWFAPEALVAAEEWISVVGEALRTCDSMIVLISRHSVASAWVEREVYFALRQNRYRNRIVPVLLDDTSTDEVARGPWWALGSTQRLHRSDKNFDAELLRIWGITVGSPK